MQAQVVSSSPREVSLSIRESDIGTMYVIQHELLKGQSVDFAGVIVKHPLTNEIWMRVATTSGSPVKELARAADSAAGSVEELQKLFGSKIRVS